MTQTLVSRSAYTGDILEEIRCTPLDQVDAMVADARRALPGWRALSLQERADCLKQAIPELKARAADIAGLISAEMGKPISNAMSEANYCHSTLAATLDGLVQSLAPRKIEDAHTETTLYYDPLGVCAAITPWNFPVSMIQWMVIPALMAGNTVVLKASECTPLAGRAYAQALQAVLPENVLQLVEGGKDHGRALVNANVQLIAFTGSRRAGQQILADAAPQFKRVILELGGKDPLIVLDDADIEAAARLAATNSFSNCGQVCVSIERIYVHESVAEKFEQLLLQNTRKIEVRPGDNASEMGPMVADFQRRHVLGQIEEAVAEGAEVMHMPDTMPDGYILPTVLRVKDTMRIMREETFGPVACVRRFGTDEEAITLANDSIYGLGAVVFGEKGHAMQVARQLDAGMIGINKSCHGANGSPWVGAKQSGYGYHGGAEGDHQFAQVRTVSIGKQ
ncbi:aldehyde dehydrogenase family protein [Biformimicrobium ophioploci]|uniref:Aldehyde dehydrogenase family protein n=1 Tax=Biformimicrobium ophioploci TaxID=3036711 RepID=A0ABQ6LVX5_9GAMM|nr:aldehyde dehydrogenase family protein [Microbulbifer sp. NKW57]GMG86211.1 aldehyde dehydrogenase family protein [Microbulbifer sp. NKW57]